jgi:hypothetical protein
MSNPKRSRKNLGLDPNIGWTQDAQLQEGVPLKIEGNSGCERK